MYIIAGLTIGFFIGCMYSSFKFGRCIRAGKFKVKGDVYEVKKVEPVARPKEISL